MSHQRRAFDTKVISLIAKATSDLWALIQGVIQNVKQPHRIRILRTIVAKAEDNDNRKGDGKFVIVLNDGQWIGAAVTGIFF